MNTWTHQINTLGDKKTAIQNEDIILKYKVNQAMLLSLPLKIKTAATEHLEGWKTYFFLLWKVQRIPTIKLYIHQKMIVHL